MSNGINYLRVSTDEQANTGYSLQYQSEKLKNYCDLKGINVLKTYKEDYSGKNFDRPAFNKLKTYVRENRKERKSQKRERRKSRRGKSED